MVKKYLDKMANRTRIGFFAAFVLLLIPSFLTFISTSKVVRQDSSMYQINEISHKLLGSVIKAESAFRGYIITGNKKLFDEYLQDEKDTYSNFGDLKSLIGAHKQQQKNIDTLHQLIDKKFSGIGKIIASFSSRNRISPELFVGDDRGITVSKDLENFVYKMQSSEKELWDDRSREVKEYSNLIRLFNVLSIIIAVLLTLYSTVVYSKENKAKKEAAAKAAEFSDQLQNRVEQLAELNTELLELRRQEKYAVTGRIARTIAHEVRNPLTNINLSIEQLRSEVEPTNTTDMLFNMVARNSDRINQLVSDLLNSTRVAELIYKNSFINDILDDSLELARDRIQLDHIKVIKEYDTEMNPIPVDREKIKIVFLNIIVNAIEAMEPYGTLKISSGIINNRSVVKIRDNGRGMTKPEVDRLFEPYFTTKEKGNGLGLANSQNIVLAHNGSISAESEPGAGSTFTVTLPIS